MRIAHKSLCWLFAAAVAAIATPLRAELPLKVGDMAPLVSGHDQDGNSWALKDKIGKSVVLLYFYPKDDTQGCTTEACGLRDDMNHLKHSGVEVAGVSFDSAESHKKFIFKYNLNFPLLSDTSGTIADAYGARGGDLKEMDRRISFLIGLDGKIIHITDSPDPAVHLKELQEAVTALGAKASP